MKFLTQHEKQTLVFLTTAALATTVITIYFALNTRQENEQVLFRKIHIIHTGGEINSDFKEMYDSNQGMYDIDYYQPLIKSSDISPKDWNVIASDIGKKYNNYDAFVIVCGKDTLAYTASALSFMIENLSKPIILSDGDVEAALKLASKTKIPEVMIASGKNLLRGCRAVHKSSDYFTSPNYPPLNLQNSLALPKEPPQIKFVSPNISVSVIKVFPGMSDAPLLNLLDNENTQGVVLEMYGDGRGPTTKDFLNAIRKLNQKGVVILAVSQCDEISEFKLDNSLLKAGVLSGNDMTTPAAYAKLCFLLSNVEDKTLIERLMEKTFRGEMSINYLTI